MHRLKSCRITLRFRGLSGHPGKAVYKNGILQPLEALPPEEKRQVTVTIVDPGSVGHEIAGYFSAEEWAQAAQDTVSLDEVRRALATISGSLSGTVIAQREERRLIAKLLP